MKLERIFLSTVWLLLAAGLLVWIFGGVQQLRSLTSWMWLVAFGVLSLPLGLWLVHALFKRSR